MTKSRLVGQLVGLLIISMTFLSFTGCASYFTRKDCEKTNWFEYGQSVAMSGKRLSGDDYIARCEKADTEINYVSLNQGFKKGMADYCRPDTVYLIGKKGEFFSPDMCDGENPRLLQQKHIAGVKDYCQKSNGYNAGLQGKPYNKICPAALEAPFLPEFNRGRKVFLVSQADQKEGQVRDIEESIRDLERRKMGLLTQMAALGNGRTVVREVVYDRGTGVRREQTTAVNDQATQQQKMSLQNDINGVDYQIRNKRTEQDKIRTEIRDIRGELARL